MIFPVLVVLYGLQEPYINIKSISCLDVSIIATLR